MFMQLMAIFLDRSSEVLVSGLIPEPFCCEASLNIIVSTGRYMRPSIPTSCGCAGLWLAEDPFAFLETLWKIRVGNCKTFETLCTPRPSWRGYNDREAPKEVTRRKLQNILTRRQNELGADDVDTIASKGGLGWFYRDKKEYATALDYFKQALDARKRILGHRHPSTVSSMINVVWCDSYIGSPNIELFKIAVEAAETVLALSNEDRVWVVKELEYLLSIGNN